MGLTFFQFLFIHQKLYQNEYPKFTFTEFYLTTKSLYYQFFSVLMLQQISVKKWLPFSFIHLKPMQLSSPDNWLYTMYFAQINTAAYCLIYLGFWHLYSKMIFIIYIVFIYKIIEIWHGTCKETTIKQYV